jgi:serine/threonine protein phosphatase PrpC
VGAEDTLLLDSCDEQVQAGDRFLLCSDGLTRMVPDSQIRVWLEKEDIRDAVDGLIKATLDAGAPDNVTALIVEAFT